MSWEQLDSRPIYENAWLRVREDDVRKPDGTTGIYGVVELQHPAVFVVALTEADEVLMLRVNRYTVGESWEVPAGGSDGDDPLVGAQRELLEETGLIASDWQPIGRMTALNGVCRAPEYVFLARGLTQAESAAREQHAEGITEVVRVPWPELIDWVRSGRITDGETVAAIMYAAIALGRI